MKYFDGAKREIKHGDIFSWFEPVQDREVFVYVTNRDGAMFFDDTPIDKFTKIGNNGQVCGMIRNRLHTRNT